VSVKSYTILIELCSRQSVKSTILKLQTSHICFYSLTFLICFKEETHKRFKHMRMKAYQLPFCAYNNVRSELKRKTKSKMGNKCHRDPGATLTNSYECDTPGPG
jgi:hypothetical protein